MKFSHLVSQLGKTVNDNSPLILTGIGVAGTVTTAVLASKASFKAARLIRIAEENAAADPYDPESVWRAQLSTKEIVKLVWPLYIPAAGTAAITITAVVMANRIGTRRAAAMAAAYAISQESFQEYREKIIDKIGEGKERKAREEIDQEHINRTDFSNTTVVVPGDLAVDFLDDYSGRPFRSTMEDVKHAVNKINNRINHQVYASLNDLYNELGLDNIPVGEEVGWTNQLVEPVFTTGVTTDKHPRPCYVLRFQVKPTRDYFKVH